MKTTYKVFLLLAVNLFFTACGIEPKPLAYGDDHCALCDMTVVDKTHAAEYTTKKGKSFPFDSVECLVWKINKAHNEDKLAFILVADYMHPGELINAKDATYLISEGIQSPMGANLSAFATEEAAQAKQKEFKGELFNWEQLKNQLKK